MRALIISQYFWPESFRINEIAETLQNRGVELEILTGKPNYPEGKVYDGYRSMGCQKGQYKGIVVNRVPIFPRGRGGIRLAINYFSFVFFGAFLGAWLVRKKNFDVIFVSAPSPILQAIPALFIGWLKGCPVVLWVQDLWPESLSATGYVNNPAALKLVEYVVRLIYRHTDLILIASAAFEKPVQALAGGTEIRYYPNSVDDSFAKPSDLTPPTVIGLEERFSILFAGNIGTAQGVEVIIEAASLLTEYKDISFVVMGDGSAREWMVQEAERRGLSNIFFPGRFPVELMPSFMQKASALLVTLADRPIFAVTVPNKIQAYLAAGRPIIACLNGEGARIVAEARAGVTVHAEDANGLAEAVLYLYRKTAAELEQVGRNGREYYKRNFEHESLVDQLVMIMHSVQKTRGAV